MGFSLDVSVPAMTVFFQGLISFFSPCVLPLLPLYIGYLSGGTGVRQEDGKIHYKRSKVMLHTLFFVIGVSFAFFLLGLGMSAVGTFFNSKQAMFARIGGILVILFGLYQLGVFGTSDVIGKERRLPFQLDKLAMSPLTALIMGFTFSFAWTPCVGPALTSVLLMAASASTKSMGFLLIGVYTLGFVLPFLAVGLFTTSLLEFFRKYRGVVQYTVKIGGVLMILMGFMMFTGKMNAITGYLSSVTPGQGVEQTAGAPSNGEEASAGSQSAVGSEDAAGGQSAADNENAAGGRSAAGSADAAGGQSTADNGNAAGGKSAADSSSAAGGQNAADGTGAGGSAAANSGDAAASEPVVLPALDFELKDQYGNTHTLEDYKGKTIFLNFWATWCPPCRAEMPDIQNLYENAETEGDDAVIVLGVAAPNMGQEKDEAGIKAFLEENGYTYPVLMDTTGELFNGYGIYSFPTTFMIDREGNVFGYVSGMLSEDMMHSIIRQTLEGKRDGT